MKLKQHDVSFFMKYTLKCFPKVNDVLKKVEISWWCATNSPSCPRSRSSGPGIRHRADSCTMDTPKRLQVSSAQPEICILSPRRQGHVWANKYTQLGDRQQTRQQRSEDLWEGSEGVFEDSLCCWVTGSDHVCASVLVVRRSSLAPTGSLWDQGGTRYQVLIMGCQRWACTGKGTCQGDTTVSER